jgi:hypothetical protein
LKLVHFWFVFPDRRIKVPNSCELGPLAGDVHDNGNVEDTDDCTACKIATCDDGVQNGGESDLDCGGMACAKCGIGLGCGGPSDCGAGVLCEENKCTYARSCKALKDAIPEIPSGIYAVDLDGVGPDPEQSVYCEQSEFGGGWTRIMSAKYPFFYNNATWQDYNAGQPEQDNYSIVGKRGLFKDGITYTFRYAVGNAQTFKDGPILFQVAWQQGHDPFTAVTTAWITCSSAATSRSPAAASTACTTSTPPPATRPTSTSTTASAAGGCRWSPATIGTSTAIPPGTSTASSAG